MKQERPGLVVLMIELEGALAQMPSNTEPTKMWSPYREPLARFLNKYPEEVLPSILSPLASFPASLVTICRRKRHKGVEIGK